MDDDTQLNTATPRATPRGTYSMTMSHLPLPPGSTPPVMVPPSVPPVSAAWGGAESEGGVDWRRALSAVLRFKWLICGVTLLGTTAGFGAARFVKPQYGAQATIWIDATERERWGQGQDRGPIRQGQLLDPQAWVDLLKSYVVLDQVVRDQRLLLEPQSPADAAALATLHVTNQYRPGAYPLTLDEAGPAWTRTTTDGAEPERG